MNESAGKLQGILDIEPPLLPPEAGAETILAMLLAAAVAILALLLWRRARSPRARARRGLAGLRSSHIQARIDARSAAFQLAALLRAGLGVAQIDRATPLPARLESHRQRWQSFLDELGDARYTRTPCSDDRLAALLAEAHFWLRRWP